MISKSLGVKNEDQAREWFKNHQVVHEKFEIWNKELEKKIKELQNKADNYLSSFKEVRGYKRSNKSRKFPTTKKSKK